MLKIFIIYVNTKQVVEPKVNIKLKKDLPLYPYMTALHKFAEINGKKKSRKYSIDYY
jgi:hypothetical protein